MAKPKKTKSSIAVLIASEEAMIGMLNRYVELALRITAENAAHEEHIASLNTTHDATMQPLREEMAVLESSLQLFVTNNRSTLFPEGAKKSREYANATLGFRDTPFAVKPIVKGDKDKVIAERLSQLDWGDPFMDWEPVLDKKALLAARLQLTPAQLQQAGIKFEDGEQFFITPKAASVDRVAHQVEAAS